MADDPVADVSKYIADEYSKEWQRKGSLETRSLALATANVAIATLLMAWIDRLNALPDVSHGCSRVWMLMAATCSLASVVLSLTAAIAFTYKSPKVQAFRQVLEWTETGKTGTSAVIARSYLGQLDSARRANDNKFRLIALALLLLLIASVVAVATLTTALWN